MLFNPTYRAYKHTKRLIFLFLGLVPVLLSAQPLWQVEWTPTKLIHRRTPALEVGVSVVWKKNNTLGLYTGFSTGKTPNSPLPSNAAQRYHQWRMQYTYLFPFASSRTGNSGWLLGMELGLLHEILNRPAGSFTDEETDIRYNHQGFDRNRVLHKQLFITGVQTRIAPRLLMQVGMHFGYAVQVRNTEFKNLQEQPQQAGGGCLACGIAELGAAFGGLTPQRASDYRRTGQPRHVEGLAHLNLQLNLVYRLTRQAVEQPLPH